MINRIRINHRHREAAENRRLTVAMIGTRGIPARYGGFETAVEEVGRRLVERGHQVIVYTRRPRGCDKNDDIPAYLGVDLVHLPAARSKTLETLSHTALSAVHLLRSQTVDVVILFNAANSVFLPLLRRRGVRVATHVDGMEWKRAKWGAAGRKYYRVAEGLAVRWSDALISDAQGIADYYSDEFGVGSDIIRYGAPILTDVQIDKLADLNLRQQSYHLIVARFEPENHVDVAVAGYRASSAKLPLIVVGSAPYAGHYTEQIKKLADGDPRIRLLGGIWDQELLDQLYAHAATYIHGHSVGGTNPSLLRAMGAGTPVLAYDVVFNRETLGTAEGYWTDEASLTQLMEEAEAHMATHAERGRALQERAARLYRWDDVADGYEALCIRIAALPHRRRRSRRGGSSFIELLRR